MNFTFDIAPYRGAAPLTFGLPRAEAARLLGRPKVGPREMDHWGAAGELAVGYDAENRIDHLGFVPGNLHLSFQGTILWTPNDPVDPNPFLLRLDPAPMECFGALLFLKIGVLTDGFHTHDPQRYAFTLFVAGRWDACARRMSEPDLSAYRVERNGGPLRGKS